ncbi:MAG: SPFH/Band 7/PHB domain protein [Anaerolineae bacterium]|nr:SPFH/Band 7/PHB domain protein [Anaerolineae bacterium]
MPQELTFLIIAVGAFFVLYILSGVIRVLAEYERVVILRLGRYASTRGPGLTIVIPFLEAALKVDMREKFLDIPSQTAITKDNAAISIDFLVYYRIVEPRLAKLSVENAEKATVQIATTTLRAVLGDIDLDDVLSKREEINTILRTKLDESTERWGMKITAVEIREIETPRLIQEAMNLQMSAERERRAAVTKAQGEREADVMVAEGQKQASILKAEGEKQANILKAEGERQAQLLRAQGFAAALEAINGKAPDLDEKTLVLQYLEMMEKVGTSPSTRFIIPMELTGLMERAAQAAGLNGSIR